MLQDLHTEAGQIAMREGKAAELRFYQSFATPPQWIAEDKAKVLAGHDFIVGNKRVEVKSNSGWNEKTSEPHTTACVEVITRGGNEVGWKKGGADLLVLINRLDWTAHIYNAKALKRFSYGKSTFKMYDAQCFLMDWTESRAGYIKTVQL
jgi:hypothetical protein